AVAGLRRALSWAALVRRQCLPFWTLHRSRILRRIAMHRMGRILLSRLLGGLLCVAVSTIAAAGDKTAWPTPDWQVDKPESQHMSSAGLEKVRDWLKDSGAKAGLVVR